jgi:hypothetical protein
LDGELRIAAIAKSGDAIDKVGFGSGEGRAAYHLRGHERALNVFHPHQVTPVIGQITGVGRLKSLCQFHVAGDGFGQLRRDWRGVRQAGQSFVRRAVQQDGGTRASLHHRSVTVRRLAGLQDAAHGECDG